MAVVTDTSSPFTKEVVESFWVLDNLLLRLLKDIKDFIATSLLSHPQSKIQQTAVFLILVLHENKNPKSSGQP